MMTDRSLNAESKFVCGVNVSHKAGNAELQIQA